MNSQLQKEINFLNNEKKSNEKALKGQQKTMSRMLKGGMGKDMLKEMEKRERKKMGFFKWYFYKLFKSK